jgi:hypothetical protein
MRKREILNKMKTVYLVKSFGPSNGYVNLKAFYDLEDAEAYYDVIEKQIRDADSKEEFVEIEDLTVE